jgi:succinate dehydrogenase/fumarate reductase flavoprotein subunit
MLQSIAWPYPIRYQKQREVSTDVLVLGGGVAGCFAAISAAQKGVNVTLVEKGSTIRSGAGGAGCDHWVHTPNPCSKITAEELVAYELESNGGYCNGLSRYIAARESYDTLLELEKMGGKIRDTEDEFKGADFRDEKTKFLFAYDYENKIHFRVWGTTFKPALYKECKRLGVNIYDRVMATSLLTKRGQQESRVVGATGLNVRTGEFLVFKAKATINCLSRHQRNFVFSSELRGLSSFRPPNIVGDGHAMAWRAGAVFTMMEKTSATTFGSGYSFPSYGSGNPFNTWFPCTMVDAKAKEIPWVDRDGRTLTNISERTRPALGQFFLGERSMAYNYRKPQLIPDLEERIKKGEFTLPLYADLTTMPDHERRAIWGLMVGEEGKTKIPILKVYTEAGFDPNKDLLQGYQFLRGDQMSEIGHPKERTTGEIADAGGLLIDWDLRTTLEGLYAAGDALFASNYYYHAATTGRYAGRKAAEYAHNAEMPIATKKQVDDEKARVYAPLKRQNGIEWKELNAAICRVMQNYCSEPKNEELMKIGSLWLKDLEDNEITKAYADNPHKLMRVLETINILTCSQMVIHASLGRKASSTFLNFLRLDYPLLDPPEWHKWITIKLTREGIDISELPINFWGSLEKNYQAHFGLPEATERR